MLSGKQRAEIQRRFRVLRAGAQGRPSQTDMDHDAALPIGRYFRIEKGYIEATDEERDRIAQRFGCNVGEVPTFAAVEALEARTA